MILLQWVWSTRTCPKLSKKKKKKKEYSATKEDKQP